MKLSIYTGVRNGLTLDFPIVEMLTHHLPLADEMIVNEGYSGGWHLRANFWTGSEGPHHQEQLGPFRPFGLAPAIGGGCPAGLHRRLVYQARLRRVHPGVGVQQGSRATRPHVSHCPSCSFHPLLRKLPSGEHQALEKSRWPRFGFRIHRNVVDIEVVGDGANIRQIGHDFPPVSDEWIECHHFGAVRDPARLRQKWRNDTAMKRPRPT